MTRKIVFLFPGYPEKPTAGNYLEVSLIFDREGFKIEPVEIDWELELHEAMVDASENVNQRLEKYDDPEICFFGHSLGAVVALNISPEFSPDAQILAGMSPEFEEDWQSFSKTQKKLGSAAEKLASLFTDTPQQLQHRPILEALSNKDIGDIYLVYGEREYEGWKGIEYLGMGGQLTDKRAELLDAEEIIAPNSKHEMVSQNYMQTLEDIVREL